MRNSRNFHAFHLVNPSPWPLVASLATFFFVSGFLSMGFSDLYVVQLLKVAGFAVVITACNWWLDVTKEASSDAMHSTFVQNGILAGIVFFIASESMFFFSLFWSFFDGSFNPDFSIGSIWPPFKVQSFSLVGLPFLNTAVLLSSGFTVSRGHEDTILGKNIDAIEMHEATLSLGAAFSLFQSEEYVASAFDFCDSVFAAAFFLTTGFHGSHVSIGSFLMLACYFISSFDLHEKTSKRHLGLEFSIAYWHFVDLIWLLVFSLMYVWGS